MNQEVLPESLSIGALADRLIAIDQHLINACSAFRVLNNGCAHPAGSRLRGKTDSRCPILTSLAIGHELRTELSGQCTAFVGAVEASISAASGASERCRLSVALCDFLIAFDCSLEEKQMRISRLRENIASEHQAPGEMYDLFSTVMTGLEAVRH
jgi:hypothetical protein